MLRRDLSLLITAGRITIKLPLRSRQLAAVIRDTNIQRAFSSTPIAAKQPDNQPTTYTLDDAILHHLSKTKATRSPISLNDLLQQYDTRASRVLNTVLPNIPLPRTTLFEPKSCDIRSDNTPRGIILVVHALQDGDVYDLEVSSGFCVQPIESEPCVITCAHTLEKIRRSALLKSPTCTSATLFLSGHHDEPMFASEVLTCLPRFDLVIYSIDPHDRQTRSFDTIQPLSISMYPFPPGMPITTRFYPKSVGTTDYDAPFGTWTPGKVTGYRDWAGSEAEPGSYDTLAHLLFLPTPTPGTSGAPIIDANTGAVVGIVTGSRMHNRVEGLQGWATPAEAIFNMFSLPGMPSERRGTN